MANTLRFKRGLVSGIPTAALGEPLFTTDTFDLYIGNGTGNTRFQKYIASGTTSQLLRGDGSLLTMPIVLTSPSNGQVLKYNGTNWVNSSDAGITGSGANGQVTFWNSASTITGSNNLFWDATNNRLGIGTASPIAKIHLSSASGDHIKIDRTGQTDRAILVSGSNLFSFGTWSNPTQLNITSTGNILVNSTTDNGLRFQVTGDGYFSGSVGIGSSTLTARTLRLSKNITGGGVAYGIFNDGQVQSDVNTVVFNYDSQSNTASGFTLPTYVHYRAAQATLNGTVTSQTGFLANSNLTGATNNYGFYGDIASGTGRWNLYMNGTAANYINGNLGIGTTSAGGKLHVAPTISSGTINQSIILSGANESTAGAHGGFFGQRVVSGNTRQGAVVNGTGSLTLNATNYNIDFIIGAITPADDTNLKMRLDASGNLGLGTASPTSYSGFTTLSINNATHGGVLDLLRNNVRTGSFYTGLSGADVSLFAIANVPLIFGTNNTERGRIFADGNFGIGTGNSNAGFKLDVNGTMRVSGASTFSSSVGIGVTTPLTLLHINGADPILLVKDTETGAASANARLRLAESGAAGAVGEYWDVHHTGLDLAFTRSDYGEVARFSTTGNLGLGTASPSQKLDIQSLGDVNSYINVRQTGNGSTASPIYSGILFSGSSNYAKGLIASENRQLSTWDSDMVFYTVNASGGAIGNLSERMRILGNVGSSPILRFNGASTIQTSTGNFTISTAGGNGNILLSPNGSGNVQISSAATFSSSVTGASFIPTSSTIPTNGMYLPSANSLGFATNGTLDMTINSRGDIGVGVTPSTWSLGKSIEINSAGQGITSLQLGDTFIMNGVYYNSSLRYANSSYAISLYRQFRGVHSWYYAPQGTIGNTVTFDIPMTLETTGNLLLGSTTDDTVNRLQVTGSGTFSSSVTSTQFNLSALNTAPATSSSTGTLGEIRIDADHIYVCTATNTWKRVAISTF